MRNKSKYFFTNASATAVAVLGSIASIVGLLFFWFEKIGEVYSIFSSFFLGTISSILAALIVYVFSRFLSRRKLRVFISYTHDDAEFVTKLVEDLQVLGLQPLFDRLELKVGDDIQTAIDSMIDKSDYFVFVVSEKSTISDWTRKELDQAISRDKKILPVVLNPSELPEPLSGVFYADFSGDYDKGLAQLKQAFSRKISKNLSRPEAN